MSEILFQSTDGCYAITPDGMKKLSGYDCLGKLPDGDWIMNVFDGKFVVIADRSGKNLPYVSYGNKLEQMKLTIQSEQKDE